jgi:hypothetical protein
MNDERFDALLRRLERNDVALPSDLGGCNSPEIAEIESRCPSCSEAVSPPMTQCDLCLVYKGSLLLQHCTPSWFGPKTAGKPVELPV